VIIVNRKEIMEFMPHREPMLLVDEVEISSDGQVSMGQYTVRGDEWFLQGHFPGFPVVPGVILCEIMAQSCCALLKEELAGKTPFFTGIDKVRFRQMVRPADIVKTHTKINRRKGDFFFTSCKATVNGKVAAIGELSFMLMKNEETPE
jgi:3-hydroxyacyl-[acyl-carrier-protein] dehydratase